MRSASANVLLGKRDTSVIPHAAGGLGLERTQYFRTEGKMLMTNANEKEETRQRVEESSKQEERRRGQVFHCNLIQEG